MKPQVTGLLFDIISATLCRQSTGTGIGTAVILTIATYSSTDSMATS